MFRKKICREIQSTIFILNNIYYYFFFFGKSCRLCDNVGKYCRAGQTTDDNMAHVKFMLGT